MSENKPAEPIDYILNSELSGVLSKGFAQLCRVRPDFPVSYLASWLKSYSESESHRKIKKQTIAQKHEEHRQMEQTANRRIAQSEQLKKKEVDEVNSEEEKFSEQLQRTQHIEDLLVSWLPEYLEKRYKLSGVYVGNLTHLRKPLELHNFEAGAEFDTESPKVIEYIGASQSHKGIMLMKILPSETGISYDCFNEPEPEPEPEAAEGEENPIPKQPKKTYIYVPDVTKNDRIYYFKYPKLGSYACFPLKLKSYLTESAFDQGLIDYKQYVKIKQETDREHSQKVNELKQEYEQAKKKYEQFEVPEEEPNPDAEAQKKVLEEQMLKLEANLNELESNAPITPQPAFNVLQKIYMIGCDTLGQDRKINEKDLNEIDEKSKKFKTKFEQKQRKMLLSDILTYIEDENKIEALQNQYREFEKSALAQSEEISKEKSTKEKQLEYEISVAKWKKMEAIFEEPAFEKSMQTYFSYNVPKFQEILQIALMLLRYPKKQINLSRTNKLDYRKVKTEKFIQDFFVKLCEYDLRPESTETCDEEYKINKILQRLEKIDLEQVIKYNAFIWALAYHIKGLCWTRIQCRDSKVEAHELSKKAKQDRQLEIEKYEEQIHKALETHKAELDEAGLEAFNEEQWLANYSSENPKPQPTEETSLPVYLDIE